MFMNGDLGVEGSWGQKSRVSRLAVDSSMLYILLTRFHVDFYFVATRLLSRRSHTRSQARDDTAEEKERETPSKEADRQRLHKWLRLLLFQLLDTILQVQQHSSRRQSALFIAPTVAEASQSSLATMVPT